MMSHFDNATAEILQFPRRGRLTALPRQANIANVCVAPSYHERAILEDAEERMRVAKNQPASPDFY